MRFFLQLLISFSSYKSVIHVPFSDYYFPSRLALAWYPLTICSVLEWTPTLI